MHYLSIPKYGIIKFKYRFAFFVKSHFQVAVFERSSYSN